MEFENDDEAYKPLLNICGGDRREARLIMEAIDENTPKKPKKRKGGDRRRPEDIKHYAVVDALSGEIVNDDCTTMMQVAEALGLRCLPGPATRDKIKRAIRGELYERGPEEKYKIIEL